MNSRLQVGLSLVLVVGLAPTCQSFRPSVQLALDRAEIQDAVAKGFPVTKEAFPVRATLRNPQVILRDGDHRVGLSLEAEIRLPILEPFRGRIAGIGVPYYDAEQKAFFLKQPELERPELPGLSAAKLDVISAAVERVAGPVLQSTPIYTVRDHTLTESAARYLLEEVSVHDGKLHLTLSTPDDLVTSSATPAVIAGSITGFLAILLGAWMLRRRIGRV